MIKVTDVAYARFRAPDLDRMESFLKDFGLTRSARTNTALYMRGTDGDHHLHITEIGEPAFLGFAFNAASEEDLHIISQAKGASAVENISEPGGGKRVKLSDPDNFIIEVVHGVEELSPCKHCTYPRKTVDNEYKIRDRTIKSFEYLNWPKEMDKTSTRFPKKK